MPQQLSTRDDLKRDPLQEWIRIGLEWVAAHRQTVLSILGTVAVAGIVAAFMYSSFRNLQKQAWGKYSTGQNWMYANNPENALNLFNDVISNYSHTPAAVYSLLSKGDLLYQQKKYPEAVEAYKQCAEKKPGKVVLPFVLASLATAQEDSGDFQAAIATYKSFISEFPEHFLAPKIYESLARTYEASVNPDAAKEIYEKIITAFPGTSWSDKARLRYQALAPQPFQTPVTQNIPSQSNPERPGN